MFYGILSSFLCAKVSVSKFFRHKQLLFRRSASVLPGLKDWPVCPCTFQDIVIAFKLDLHVTSQKIIDRTPNKFVPRLSSYFRIVLLKSSTMLLCHVVQTRRGSPVDRRPSTAEAPPIGKLYPFSKMAIAFEPLM